MNRPLILVLAAAGCAAAFAAGARRASAQTPAAAPGLQLIAESRDTAVYTFRHDGHSCYVATTVGGSGISLQCPK